MDGIGKAYAKHVSSESFRMNSFDDFSLQLAGKGLNIIFIARSLEKLKAVAKEIESDYNVQTAVIDVDFTHEPAIV